MLKILLLTAGIIAIAIALLALKLRVRGDAPGPMTHIGASRAMRERGIHCVESMDAIERYHLKTRKHAREKVEKL